LLDEDSSDDDASLDEELVELSSLLVLDELEESDELLLSSAGASLPGQR
jgi:hypothetical protein